MFTFDFSLILFIPLGIVINRNRINPQPIGVVARAKKKKTPKNKTSLWVRVYWTDAKRRTCAVTIQFKKDSGINDLR